MTRRGLTTATSQHELFSRETLPPPQPCALGLLPALCPCEVDVVLDKSKTLYWCLCVEAPGLVTV